MPLFDDIVQGIIAPQLELLELGRDPQFVGQYKSSNSLDHVLAHLVAQTSGKAALLATDSGGNLSVLDSLCKAQLVSIHGDTTDIDTQITVLSTLFSTGGLGYNVLQALYDVYDATNHAIKVKVIP